MRQPFFPWWPTKLLIVKRPGPSVHARKRNKQVIKSRLWAESHILRPLRCRADTWWRPGDRKDLMNLGFFGPGIMVPGSTLGKRRLRRQKPCLVLKIACQQLVTWLWVSKWRPAHKICTHIVVNGWGTNLEYEKDNTIVDGRHLVYKACTTGKGNTTQLE